jgi:hypothetical protein
MRFTRGWAVAHVVVVLRVPDLGTALDVCRPFLDALDAVSVSAEPAAVSGGGFFQVRWLVSEPVRDGEDVDETLRRTGVAVLAVLGLSGQVPDLVTVEGRRMARVIRQGTDHCAAVHPTAVACEVFVGLGADPLDPAAEILDDEDDEGFESLDDEGFESLDDEGFESLDDDEDDDEDEAPATSPATGVG